MKGTLEYAEHCMTVWAAWHIGYEEYGWPTYSSEVSAQQRARTATVVDGVAAYRGRVEVGQKTVPREPPPMPKETRCGSRTRVPEIDRARLGPSVNRHLLDLDEFDKLTANVLRAHYLATKETVKERADVFGIGVSAYWAKHKAGLYWLAGRLTLVKRA